MLARDVQTAGRLGRACYARWCRSSRPRAIASRPSGASYPSHRGVGRGRPVPHAAASFVRRWCGRSVAFNRRSRRLPSPTPRPRGAWRSRWPAGRRRRYSRPKSRARAFCRTRRGRRLGPPSGAKAVVVDGGYIVNGRWRFASGSEHCPWLGGDRVAIEADGKPRFEKQGRPVMRTMLSGATRRNSTTSGT